MAAETPRTPERARLTLLLLTLVTTVFSAGLAALQSDAAIRAEEANTRSQHLAVLTSAELVRQGQQSAYDLETLAAYVKYSQQALVLEYTALEIEAAGSQAEAAALRQQAGTAAARARAAQELSVFFADPRYAPQAEGALPDSAAYLADMARTAGDLVAQQNAAADSYHHWDGKSDAYLTILTLLALVFFLLGVAQTAVRLRLVLAVGAVAILLGSAVWTLGLVLSG